MAIVFPTSPSNGQSVTLLGHQYTYKSNKKQWIITSTPMATHLAAGDIGSIPYQSASGTTTMLASSTAGHLLTSNGINTAPSWKAAPVSLPTQTNNSGKLLTTDGTTASWSSSITSPTLVTPVLGTPTSGNLANCTFPTLNQSTTGNAATATAATNLSGGTVAGTTGTFSGQLNSIGMASKNIDGSGFAYRVVASDVGTQSIVQWVNNAQTHQWTSLVGTDGNLQCTTSFSSLGIAATTLSATTGSFTGSITLSTNNITGGGIILADDGDIVDMNDGYCAMRFSYGVRIYSGNKTGTPVITLGNNGSILATGDIYSSYSDIRLKTVLGDIENPIEKIKSIETFYYEPNELALEKGAIVGRKVGVSAQSVEAIMPEVIGKSGIDDQYLTVQYERLVPLLIEAIKKQQEQIDILNKKLGL